MSRLPLVDLSLKFFPPALGAKVIATAGSDEKLAIAAKHGGADHLVNYNDPKWPQIVKQITGGKGVDVSYRIQAMFSNLSSPAGHL